MNNSYLILTLKTPEQKKNSLCFYKNKIGLLESSGIPA